MSTPTKTTYTIELDEEGRRFWLAEHGGGRLEPLAADTALRFLCGPNEQGVLTLPVGTKVTLETPDTEKSQQVERDQLRRAMRDAIKLQYAKVGETKTDEEADEIVAQTIAEMSAVQEKKSG